MTAELASLRDYRIGGSVKLPSDTELEQAVLGACMAAHDAIDVIFSACQPSDFYHAPHDRVAEAIIALHADGHPVTPLTVKARTGDCLDELGGLDYLAGLALAAPAGGYHTLARELADLERRRQVMIGCMDSLEGLSRRDIPVLTAIRPSLETADRVMAQSGASGRAVIADMIGGVLKRAQDAANGIMRPSVTTGLERLDDLLGGLQEADLSIYAGRPGMGKSSMLLTTAINAVMSGRPCIVFSLEMTAEQMLHRIGADLDHRLNPAHPLSYSWFRSGSAKRDQVERLAEALVQVPDILEIRDQPGQTIHDIASAARGFASRFENKLGVVVIDYLQKVDAGDRYRGNKVQEITEISNAAKSLAKRLGWPVVAGAQLNRSVEAREDKRPTLGDLRESGAIEQDADSVIGLYRPGYYIEKRKPGSVHDPKYAEWEVDYQNNKNRLDLIVLKNRHGPEDVLSLFCDMRASAIRDAVPEGVHHG